MTCRPWLAVCLLCLVVAPAWSQEDAPAPPDPQAEMRSKIQQYFPRIMAAFSKLGDWETQRDLSMQAIEKVYERNEWTGESDQWALELTRTVESKPPWAFQERFDTMLGMISDRYMLDEEQENTVKQMFIHTSMEIFQKHAPEIMQYMTEAIETRAAGDPFTPEKVAEWAKLGRPVFEDWKAQFHKNVETLMPMLDPTQQEILKRDIWATQDRLDDLDDMMVRWERGQWKVDDWGMEDDPIQRAGEARRAAGATGGDAQGAGAGEAISGVPGAKGKDGGDDLREAIRRRIEEKQREKAEKGDGEHADDDGTVRPPPMRKDSAPTGESGNADGADGAAGGGKNADAKKRGGGAKADDSDPWAKYVREFITKYKLNEDQQQKCWAMFGDARERRDSITAKIAERARNEDERKAAEAKQKAPIERLFEQMKRRLDRIPTRAQRKAVETAAPAKKEKDASPTTQMSVNPTESVGP